MKTAVLSGGGSYGAYTVGVLKKRNINYEMVVGCSTGSLMAALVSLGKWDRLEDAYTSVTQEDIFDVNPFKANGDLDYFHAAMRIMRGFKTIGETNALRATIKKFFTEADYNELKASGKKVYVTATNLSQKGKMAEYFCLTDYPYERACDYMWVSANVEVVTSLVSIDGNYYGDGGLTMLLPMRKAIDLGGTDLDCYMHQVEDVVTGERKEIENVMHYAGRCFNIGREYTIAANIVEGIDAARIAGVNFNIYYLPYDLKTSSMVFDSKQMKEWLELGYSRY